MFQLLVSLFIFIPAIEIYFLFKIGGEIGTFNTFLVIVVTGFIGASLARSQGMIILSQIQNEMNRGELPAKNIIHGLMVFAGGLLLLTPGFFTDIFGFCLVIPGPRHFLFIWVQKLIGQAMKSGNFKFQTFSTGAQRPPESNPFTKKTDSEISGDVFEAEFERKE